MTESRYDRLAPFEQAMKAAGARIRPAQRRLTDDQAEQIVTDVRGGHNAFVRTTRPWTVVDGALTWRSGSASEIVFDESGMSLVIGAERDHIRWGDLYELYIALPYSSKLAARLNPTLSAISPKPYVFAPRGLEIEGQALSRQIDWRLERAERVDWRLQLVVDDLLALLKRRGGYAPLGNPALWDALADQVVPYVRRVARIMLLTDIPGLNRLIGHGSVDDRIVAMLEQFA